MNWHFAQKYGLVLLLALAVFLVYEQTLTFDYTGQDDSALVEKRLPFLRNPANIWHAFRQDVFDNEADFYYRPLLTLSFMLDARLGGGRLFHLSNIVYHLLACLLLGLAAGYRHPSRSGMAAELLFALHPALTQAVAWLPAATIHCWPFSPLPLLSICKKTGPFNISLHGLFFLCALLTKETAVALIAIWIGYFMLFFPRSAWRKKLLP